MINPIKPNRGL